MDRVGVSVIIPTYNREKTILRSINSVLDQSFKDLELIVVDDASVDGTESIVKNINDSRVRYIKLEKNCGACIARNTGIDAAKGEYIAFQDSDDVWMSNKLERQINTLEDTGADVCFHKMIRYNIDGKSDEFPRLQTSGYIDHEKICKSIIVSTQMLVGKKDVFVKHKFDPKVKKAQDYDWAIRASEDFNFYFLNEALVEQYFQEDSISAAGLERVIETRQYFLEKYDYISKVDPKFEAYQLSVIARSKSILGLDAHQEYKRIFEIDHDPKSLIKYLISKMGLMNTVYKLRGYKNTSLPNIK